MRRVLMAAVTAAVLVGLTASPSMAQTKTRNDARGDAPRATDIRSVKVQNNGGKFAATVRIANVTERRSAVFIASTRTANDAGFVLEAFPISKGRFNARAFSISEDGNVTRLKGDCAIGGGYREGANGYFRIVVKQRCLGGAAGRVETAVVTYDWQKAKDQQQSGGARLSALRKGDADAGDAVPAGGDTLRSTITTRRG